MYKECVVGVGNKARIDVGHESRVWQMKWEMKRREVNPIFSQERGKQMWRVKSKLIKDITVRRVFRLLLNLF